MKQTVGLHKQLLNKHFLPLFLVIFINYKRGKRNASYLAKKINLKIRLYGFPSIKKSNTYIYLFTWKSKVQLFQFVMKFSTWNRISFTHIWAFLITTRFVITPIWLFIHPILSNIVKSVSGDAIHQPVPAGYLGHFDMDWDQIRESNFFSYPKKVHHRGRGEGQDSICGGGKGGEGPRDAILLQNEPT